MDSIISQLIAEWGTLGLMLLGIGYISWENWRANKHKKIGNTEIISAVNTMSGKIDNLHDKIKIVDEKVDDFKTHVQEKINDINIKVNNIPKDNLKQIVKMDIKKQEIHLKQMEDLMKLGPKLHRIIQMANHNIGSDHIFVGSFHNGNSSLSGIPYYKFDIIAERFSPSKVTQDTEFAHMYKDSDILRYDTLPSLLVQQGMVYFAVPEDGDLEISKYDDIIWRRMRGRGIKQIALRLTRDSKNTPSGFVGVVKYDMSSMNLDYLDSCGKELEEIYKDSELKETGKKI
jgi:hypothetical protein